MLQTSTIGAEGVPALGANAIIENYQSGDIENQIIDYSARWQLNLNVRFSDPTADDAITIVTRYSPTGRPAVETTWRGPIPEPTSRDPLHYPPARLVSTTTGKPAWFFMDLYERT